MKIQDLKTFEDACKVKGLDPKKVIPDFSCYPEKDRKAMEAHAKLVIIVSAANLIVNDGKEWIPDFSDRAQTKYEIWFEYDKGSSGFRYDGYDDWNTVSNVGFRLCFKTVEVGRHVAEQFVDLFNEYFL